MSNMRVTIQEFYDDYDGRVTELVLDKMEFPKCELDVKTGCKVAAAWCLGNGIVNFMYTRHIFWFSTEEDATMFKLAWG
jgi:hypothetical protein